jgi:putative effector of murein hydrolase
MRIDQMVHFSGELFRTPGFGVTLTICSYMIGVVIQKACRGASVANPVLIAMLLVAGFLNISGTSYQAYYESTQPITFLLGPATVALAVPLIKNLGHLRGRIIGIFLALTAGSVVSVLSGIGLVAICGGSRAVAFSMAPKAVTTPIAINIAQTTGGIPSLCAVFAISGGILVAISIRWLLDWTRITDVRVFGFAAGAAGSGIGAAHALSLCDLAGAFAALAVGFNGLLTPLIVPALEHFWPK